MMLTTVSGPVQKEVQMMAISKANQALYKAEAAGLMLEFEQRMKT
jgi:hypothetical protein